ncbi:helix-turn-helix domain-containing protein [Bifidobacterium miconisargentati]|uniref:helix-turn-helix domain-containing protein n=1 Tax=Bifidobacterium miconisargentati TaxID=2834437 RepID=UPI001BDC884B|nr:helix-turn-helix domain-containing protein [Bifidobacterium miconisargentati]MBW3090103.1 helix-turn-helix domain-containing protein [Bifidobacterium miconisargentati]
MSVEAYSYVMTITCLIPNHIAQAVLSHLANHADRRGRHAFPSVTTLAVAIRCSERSVQRHLRWLESRGFIRRSSNLSRVRKLPACKRPIVYELSMNEAMRTVFIEEYRARLATGDGITSRIHESYRPIGGADASPPTIPEETQGTSHEPSSETIRRGDSGGLNAVLRMSPEPSSEPSPSSPYGDCPPQTDKQSPSKPHGETSDMTASEVTASMVSKTRAGADADEDPDTWSEAGSMDAPDWIQGATVDGKPDAEDFLIRFAQVLAKEQIVGKPTRKADWRCAERLLETHGLEASMELAAWVAQDGFWCGKMLSVRSLERRWEEFRLARRHEGERRMRAARRNRELLTGIVNFLASREPRTDEGDIAAGLDPNDQAGLFAQLLDGFDPGSAGRVLRLRRPAAASRRDAGIPGTPGKREAFALVSSASVVRCPVYGFRDFPSGCSSRTGDAQRHLDGDVPPERCVVCAHDGRNLPLHGGVRTDESLDKARRDTGQGRTS